MFVIGTIVGLVMGLTGSGGALISLPLFLAGGADLKEASALSLLTVVVSGLVNLWPVRKDIDLKASVFIIPFTFLGSWLAIPLKRGVPDSVITFTILFLVLSALVSVWKKENTGSGDFPAGPRPDWPFS